MSSVTLATSASAGPNIAELLGALRLRGAIVMAILLIAIVSAGAAAILWPATYRAVGTVLIEQQELPSELVQSTITSFADQRIQVIGQRVMNTENLLRVIDRYDLYPKLRRSKPREVLLAQMREDIHIQMISADVIDPRQGRPTKANIAFSVGYDAPSPEAAARVANELVSLYLDENIKTRRRQSADAEHFLDEEAQRLNGQIAELEAKVASFKDKHTYTLPDQTVLNKENLTRREDELREIDARISSLDEQATFLDAQLLQMSPNSQVFTSTGERVMSPADRLKYLRTEYARISGIYSADHPDVRRLKREMEGLEAQAGAVDSSNDLQRQLQDDEAQLAELQQREAPEHPDIVRLRKQIDALRAQAENAPARGSKAPDHPDNPAYIQLEAQRDANRTEHASLRERHAEIEAIIADLEGRLAQAPAVEHEYADLARALDNEQIKYREVRQKQMAAKLSATLEDEQKGERFTLIDPPLPPEKPTSPNRGLILASGSLLGLVLSGLTVVLLEVKDGTVRSRRDLEALLEVPPLALVPIIETPTERARIRRRRWLRLAAALGALILALLLTHLLYRPLDVLWDAAARRLVG
jgi:uncharacterized protein involved in exopolysaccharide biosynthesis